MIRRHHRGYANGVRVGALATPAEVSEAVIRYAGDRAGGVLGGPGLAAFVRLRVSMLGSASAAISAGAPLMLLHKKELQKFIK